MRSISKPFFIAKSATVSTARLNGLDNTTFMFLSYKNSVTKLQSASPFSVNGRVMGSRIVISDSACLIKYTFVIMFSSITYYIQNSKQNNRVSKVRYIFQYLHLS
jgi:hypothetical protein